MVALAPSTHGAAARQPGVWLAATCGVMVVGALPRLVFGGTGERSAALLMLLLEACAGTAVWLLGSPRAAFVVSLGVVALFNLAAIGPRGGPPYDDRQALYSTDQTFTVDASGSGTLLPLWVEPHFSGVRPSFDLVVDAHGTTTTVACPWQHAAQRIGLPVSLSGEVRLHLSGAPSRAGDYLIVYSSARQPSVPLVAPSADLAACTPGH